MELRSLLVTRHATTTFPGFPKIGNKIASTMYLYQLNFNFEAREKKKGGITANENT